MTHFQPRRIVRMPFGGVAPVGEVNDSLNGFQGFDRLDHRPLNVLLSNVVQHRV